MELLSTQNWQEFIQNYIEEKKSVNFADGDGNRLLHHAVRLGQLEIVEWLLCIDGVDVTVENKDYKNPLDIARKTGKDKKIIGALAKKIVDDSLKLLEISWDERETGEPTPKSSRIKPTEDKIEYCLKSVENLNQEEDTDDNKLSPQQAAILIHFLENYALERDDNKGIREKVEKHFPRDDTEKDPSKGESERSTSFVRFGFDDVCQFIKSPTQLESDVEPSYEQTDILIYIIKMFALEGLLIDDIKNMIKKHFSDNEKLAVSLGLTDVDDFIDGDFDSFFKRFQKYVQRAYTQANVLIHFIESVALEGSGNPKIKDELKAYFSQYYTENDRLIFVDARTLLLHIRSKTSKNIVKKFGLQDCRKFIKGDVNTFFAQFQKYLEYFETVRALKNFLKNLEDPVKNLQGTSDVKSFLKEEFEKFIEEYDMQEKITKEELLDYIVHSYPAFQKEASGGIKKFENTDTGLFFTKLQQYIQLIQQRHLCIKQLEDEENKKGKKISDGYFVKGEFEKIIKKSCMTTKRTQEIMFDFIVHLYPEFQQTARGVNKQGSNDSVEKTAEKLINYAERIQQQNFFLKTLVGNERNLGTGVGDDKCFLREELETLIKASSRPEAITPELIFNFIVNFYPAFQKVAVGDLEKLKELRNELVHEFHKGRSAEFGREIFRLRHELFIFYYVREVERILNELEGGEETEDIHKCFDSELKTLNQHFESGDYGVSPDRPTNKPASFIWEELSRSFIPEKPGDVRKLVDRYFGFLIFIDSKKMPNNNRSEDEAPWNISLSDSNRRAIFEVLDELKRFKEHRQNEDHFDEKHYSDAKNKLRKLMPDDGIQESRFDDVWKLYETNDTKSFESECKIITEIINTLKGYKTNYRLADREVIALYDQFVRRSGIFDSDVRNSLSKNQPLVDAKQSIAEELSECSLNADILLRIGDEKFHISRGEVVRNILNTFYNAFNIYRIEFDLEKIFDDELFLKSLIKRETVKPDYMIIKILLKLEYTAPYIVRLIKRLNSDKRIEKDDLRKLVKILGTKDNTLYNKYLSELLTIPTGKLDLYQEVYEGICEDNFYIENMRYVFKKPEQVKKVLAPLERGMSSAPTLRNRICNVLNYAVLELIHDGDHEEALKILNFHLKVISTYERTDDVIVIKYKLRMAEAKIRMGLDIQKKDAKRAANVKFDEALEVLEGIAIPPDIMNPTIPLVLIHKLLIQSLLRTCYEYGEEVCALFVKFVEYGPRTEEEIYTALGKPQLYQALPSSIQECKKYEENIKIMIANNNECSSAYIAQQKKGLADLEEIHKHFKDEWGNKRRHDIHRTLSIACAHFTVGTALFEKSEYAESMEHCEDSLVRWLRAVKILKNMHDKRIVKEGIKKVMSAMLCNIVEINNILNNSSKDPEGQLSHNEAALTISTRIYQFEEHSFFVECISRMTINHRDSKLSEEESEHNRRVLTIFKEVSKFVKNKQDSKAEYSSKDIISRIAYIINELHGLDLSNSPNVAKLFRKNVLGYIPSNSEHLRLIKGILCYLRARQQADASENHQMKLDILTLLFEFEQHEYISSSISYITHELDDLETTTDPRKESLQKALRIYEEALGFEKSKQDEKFRYTPEDTVGRIAIICNEIGYSELSISQKVKLLSENQELIKALKTLKSLAAINEKHGDFISKDTVKEPEHYKIALEIEILYCKFQEAQYIFNTIVSVDDKLRDPELPEKKSRFYERVRSIYNDALQLRESREEGEGDDRHPENLTRRIESINSGLSNLMSDPDVETQLLPFDEALENIPLTINNIAHLRQRIGELLNDEKYCQVYANLSTEASIIVELIKRFHEEKPTQRNPV